MRAIVPRSRMACRLPRIAMAGEALICSSFIRSAICMCVQIRFIDGLVNEFDAGIVPNIYQQSVRTFPGIVAWGLNFGVGRQVWRAC